jgi:DHA1 family multidrug resistance protein-like MFS transporter
VQKNGKIPISPLILTFNFDSTSLDNVIVFVLGGISLREKKSKYAILFVLFFMSMSLHLQVSIFTPFAVSLGASSVIVGVLLGAASFMNLTGNLVAGPLIDRIGKKVFIVIPLFFSGSIMIGHAFVQQLDTLAVLRVLNGFSLAFLFPAALALLSDFAKNSREQGKNMAMQGLLMTFSTIVAPYVGGVIAEKIGYSGVYLVIGGGLFFAAIYGVLMIRESEIPVTVQSGKAPTTYREIVSQPAILSVFAAGFTLFFFFGTIQFELPYLIVEQGWEESETGKLFGYMGIGTFFILSMFWLQRLSAFTRVICGTLFISFCFYFLAVPPAPLPLNWMMFTIGMGTGIILPAIKTRLTEIVDKDSYGKSFAILSAVYSLGVITSSLLSGAIHSFVSPYFFAFFLGIVTVVLMLFLLIRGKQPSVV